VIRNEGVLVALLLLERAQQTPDLAEQAEQNEAKSLHPGSVAAIGSGRELLVLVQSDGGLVT
jgi:hypothetical protein